MAKNVEAIIAGLQEKTDDELNILFNTGMAKIQENNLIMQLLTASGKLSWGDECFEIQDCVVYFKVIEIGKEGNDKKIKDLFDSFLDYLKN